MSPLKRKRLGVILALLAGLSLAVFFLLQAFNENMMFFYSTTDVKQGKAPINQPFRLGGMVAENSVTRSNTSLEVRFVVTDFQNHVTVSYQGILPDLFREGQGVIAKGQLNADNLFLATEILAKHDETYMPPEVADALKKAEKISNPKAQTQP